jgi:hypothetical protein
MLLDLFPQLRILLNTNLLRLVVDKLIQAAEIHILGQQGNNVLVKGLPVRVFEVVLLALSSVLMMSCNGRMQKRLTLSCA